jgi:hypothetical protein
LIAVWAWLLIACGVSAVVYGLVAIAFGRPRPAGPQVSSSFYYAWCGGLSLALGIRLLGSSLKNHSLGLSGGWIMIALLAALIVRLIRLRLKQQAVTRSLRK